MLLISSNDKFKRIRELLQQIGTDIFKNDLFIKNVVTYPEKIAVEFEGLNLTYKTLNQEVEKLAIYLIRHGINSQDYVALTVQRSEKLIIAMLPE
jgi:non-ribosomal peptide synthetase component F